MHGNQAAIHHFSKELEVELKTNSVQYWKGKYLAEVNSRRKVGEMDICEQSLPVKNHGMPASASGGKGGLRGEILHSSST